MSEPAAAASGAVGDIQPASLTALERRYRSGMQRRFGLLYHLSGLGLFLRRLRFEEHSAENIRKAAARGPVVYVLHTESMADWLALNVVLNRRRLPLARVTPGLRSTWVAPLRTMVPQLWRIFREWLSQGRAPDPLASGFLERAVASGVTSAIFVVPPRRLGSRRSRRSEDAVDHVLRAQKHAQRPVQLVPVVVVWQRRPKAARSVVGRFMLGTEDDPGTFQKARMVVSRSVDALVQAGEPVALPELMGRLEGQAHGKQARAARLLLRRYLYRESRVVRGPGVRPLRWTRHLVLRSAQIRQLIAEEAQARGTPEDKVRREVEGQLEHIAAKLSWPVMRTARWLLRQLWTRIYSGVDIPEEDLEKVRAAVRAGSAVIVPCHRSHLDYMLMSSVLFEHDITVPHVVAGENLSFWPLGSILRRCGAVFIKRKFRDDRVHPAVFEAYLRQLISDGFPLEFFIEGGRSRTGKLLRARLGVLRMVLEARATMRADQKITLLPVAISYEQVAESKAFAAELEGVDKRDEDLGQLAKAGSVLRKRLGRVYLRVGEPLVLDDALLGGAPLDELSRERQREVLLRTGERVMHRIATSMVILPTGLVALALLASPARGIRHSVLLARAQRFERMLRALGAQPAVSLTFGAWAVREALQRFESEKWVKRLADESEDPILQVFSERRPSIAYAKNALVHFLAPASLLAAAMRAVGRADGPEVDELFQLQVFLLRYEVTLDPDSSLEEISDDARRALRLHGALVEGEDGDELGPDGLVAEVAGIMADQLEALLLVLRGARQLRDKDLGVDELPSRIRDLGQGLHAVDEIRYAEALSLPGLKQGVRALVEDGVIEVRSGGGGLQFDEEGWNLYNDALRRLIA